MVGRRQIKTVLNIADCTARKYFFSLSVVKLIPPFFTLLGTSFIACSISENNEENLKPKKSSNHIQPCYSLAVFCAREV